MMSAKLRVFGGGSFHFNCGETSGPSQVNFLGIVSPAEKASLEICKDIVPPFSWAKRFPEGHRDTQRTKPIRTATLLHAKIFSTLPRSTMPAQTFAHCARA